jgi:hypothetical protein
MDLDNLMTFIHPWNLPIHQLSKSLLHITNLFFAMVDIIHHMVHCFSIYEQIDGGFPHQVWPYVHSWNFALWDGPQENKSQKSMKCESRKD